MKKLIVLIFCFELVLFGCALRGGRISRDQRGERLAIERGRLTELTDPAARTKSYIVISDILVSYVADAARDQDHEGFRGLLVQYGRSIESARDTVATLERGSNGKSQAHEDLESALRRHIQALEELKSGIEAEDRASLGAAIQLATTIHQEIGKVRSPTNLEN